MAMVFAIVEKTGRNHPFMVRPAILTKEITDATVLQEMKEKEQATADAKKK